MERNRKKSIIESLLFVSEKPLTHRVIETVFEKEYQKDEVEEIINEIKNDFKNSDRGLKLLEVSNGWQIRTKEENLNWLKKLENIKPIRLSQASLEVLAIIAYKQPITKAEIDKIRGVDSYHLLKTLMEKNLAKISGRADYPGRPLLYTTSKDFLEIFGLSDLMELPSEKEIKELVPEDISSENFIEKTGESLRELVSEKSSVEITNIDEDTETVLEELQEIGKEMKVDIDLVQEKVDILFNDACRKYEKQRKGIYEEAV
jgi:segregation and condensation protein B